MTKNQYAYVGGNPITYVDPLGLQSVGPTGAYVGPPITKPMLRLPDYIKLAAGYFVGTGSLTWSRNGKLYGSFGLRRPYPQPLNAGVSLNAGYLACPKPSSDKQDRFHTGPGISTVSAHRALGGGVAYSPGEGFAIEAGLGFGVSTQGLDPKAEIGGDMGYELYDIGLGW